MERKMNVADFATLVGTTSKTIYEKLKKNDELPVNEKLLTVNEKVKGREITLIVTNSEQISYYQNLYGKDTVNDGKYYETLTENNGYKQVNNVSKSVNDVQQPVKTFDTADLESKLFDKLLTVNKEFNTRYEEKITQLISVSNELAEVKSRQLLLEDKAGREGLYIKEINELKTDNESIKKSNARLKYVIITLIMVIIGFVMYIVMVNNVSQPVNDLQESVTNEQVIAPQVSQPVKNVS